MDEEEVRATAPRRWASMLDRWEERERRLDRRAAIVACVVANAHKGKSGRPFRAEDFMPRYAKESGRGRRMSAEEMQRRVLALHAALTGEDRRAEAR
jgi:hypothetical protein